MVENNLLEKRTKDLVGYIRAQVSRDAFDSWAYTTYALSVLTEIYSFGVQHGITARGNLEKEDNKFRDLREKSPKVYEIMKAFIMSEQTSDDYNTFFYNLSDIQL